MYAIDWLGMGRSVCMPVQVWVKCNDIPGCIYEAESFFVKLLKEWRECVGLKKMTPIGHSPGLYVYALRYLERVHRLILHSPASVHSYTTVPLLIYMYFVELQYF